MTRVVASAATLHAQTRFAACEVRGLGYATTMATGPLARSVTAPALSPWRRLSQRLSPSWLAGPRAQRVRAVLARVTDLFPWTPLGVALGAGAYAALRIFAYAQLDLVWLVTGYAALGLCALAPLFVLPGALWLRVRSAPTQRDRLLLETGQSALTGYAQPSLLWVPLLQVRWEWLAPADAQVDRQHQRGAWLERVAFRERGEHAAIVRRVVVEDPFGLSRVAFRSVQARTVVVLPRIGALRQLPSLASLAAGSDLPHPMGMEDGDRLELQRYTPGDPARFIHWRVFARTRRLMVRRPERAVAVAKRCAAFLIAGPHDDASAAVARLSLERNLLGNDWVFGTDLAPSGVSRVDAALQQIIDSVQAREAAGRGLGAFVTQVDKQGPASLIVFAPPEPGAWVDTVSQLARRRQLRVVVGVDSVDVAVARPWWLRLLTLRPSTEGVNAQGVESLVHTLGRAGVPVSVLDRSTGRPLGAAQQRALRPLAVIPPSPGASVLGGRA